MEDLNFASKETATITLNLEADVSEIKNNFAHPNCTQDLGEISLGLCEHHNNLAHEKGYCAPFQTPPTLIDFINNMEEHYMANDNGTIYKTVRFGDFDNTPDFDTPKLNVSGFEGCPHIYGKIYWRGIIYEIRQKITETYLEEGKKTGGDWTGYKVGDFTQRFLSKESLNRAFDMIKIMMDE